MQINQIVEEYLKCSKVCAEINYADPSSVKKNNKAIDSMYKLVEEASKTGPEAIAALTDLLDDPIASNWIAHQLVEKVDLNPQITKKCFLIVERLAASGNNPTNALGEKMWLDEWRKKKNFK